MDDKQGRQATVLTVVRPSPRPLSQATIELLEELLEQARSGALDGLALAALYVDGAYSLRLRGSAAEPCHQMGVAGMMAALSKMVLTPD